MITVAANAMAKRLPESRACVMTKIGQCQRYSPYDRRPISTNKSCEKNFFTNTPFGLITTAMMTADEMVVAAKPPWYRRASATCTVAMSTPITTIDAIASASATSERASTNRFGALRHGRHNNATAAPRSRPLERVMVLRYKKLVRVSLS